MVVRIGKATLLRCPGFRDKNGRFTFRTASAGWDGYVVPYWDEAGHVTGLQVRLFVGGYQTVRGTRQAALYHVAGCTTSGGDLYVTEGATKANVAHHCAGLCVMAVAGQTLMPEHVAVIQRLQPGRVIIALDQEANPNTARARERWIRRLQLADLSVWTAVWEGADVGGPKGLDDLVQAGGRPRVRPVVHPPPGISERRIPEPTDAAGPVDAGMTLSQARDITRGKIEQFLTQRRPGQALVVSSAPGTGKTTAVAAALRRRGTAARIVVGTRRLAAETAEEHGYAVVQGRNAGNCARSAVVAALGTRGHDVARLTCGSEAEPRCPERAQCPYWDQFDAAVPLIGTAEQLWNPHFLRGAGVIVIDDADLTRSLVERVAISAATLGRAVEQLERRRRPAAVALLPLMHHAVIAAPRREDGRPGPALIGPAVWDHLAKTASRYGEDLCVRVEALPHRPSLPTPEADGPLTVEDVEAVPPAHIRRLFAALQEERPAFQSGDPFNSRLRLDANGIELAALRDHARIRGGRACVADTALLVLDATPIPALVDHLTREHDRLPDVRASVRLPENVTVVQYASASNGHAVLRHPGRLGAVLAEVQAERARRPAPGPADEAVVAFQACQRQLIAAGFAESQVFHFGNARGSNALQDVQRLHVIGCPMPPSYDLVYLAQVVHHGESPVSAQLVLRPRRYGGQRYAVTVVDFEDARVAAFLRGARDDELLQVIHRACVLLLHHQRRFEDPPERRSSVRVVLHTSHPVPGLRVDELYLTAVRTTTNEARAADARRRILTAKADLQRRGGDATVAAIARASKANRRTVRKVLGTDGHTLKEDLLKNGVITRPQCSEPTWVEEVP